MPDLGKYAPEVLGAYAVGVGLIAVLVCVTLWRARQVRRALRAVERRREAGRG